MYLSVTPKVRKILRLYWGIGVIQGGSDGLRDNRGHSRAVRGDEVKG